MVGLVNKVGHRVRASALAVEVLAVELELGHGAVVLDGLNSLKGSEVPGLDGDVDGDCPSGCSFIA